MSVPWVDLPKDVAFRLEEPPNGEFTTHSFLLPDGRHLNVKLNKIFPMMDLTFLDAEVK